MPLLTNELWRGKLSESIDRAISRHGYRLAAFVYMPEHVHLLVCPCQDAAGIAQLLRAIKRPYSYRIKQLLLAANSPLLKKCCHPSTTCTTIRFDGAFVPRR